MIEEFTDQIVDLKQRLSEICGGFYRREEGGGGGGEEVEMPRLGREG